MCTWRYMLCTFALKNVFSVSSHPALKFVYLDVSSFHKALWKTYYFSAAFPISLCRFLIHKSNLHSIITENLDYYGLLFPFAEFTTMAGRRLRDAVRAILTRDGNGEFGSNVHIVIAGLSNTYSQYVTTYEEYEIQRYEVLTSCLSNFLFLILQATKFLNFHCLCHPL